MRVEPDSAQMLSMKDENTDIYPPGHLLVLGMGNEILSDDAIGLRVLDFVRDLTSGRVDNRLVTLLSLQTGGLDLIYELEGYDYLIVVDSYFVHNARPGRIRILGEDDLKSSAAIDSAHLLSLPAALELSKHLGYRTPKLLGAVVVDVGENSMVFGKELSGDVAGAAHKAADIVCGLVADHLDNVSGTHE